MIRFAVGLGVWVVWSVIVGAVAPRLPNRWFDRPGCSVSAQEVRWAEAVGVRRWKGLLPDAGGWFSSSGRKDAFIRTDVGALQRFAIEGRRAECVHWTVLALAPTFFLWNPMGDAWAMVAFGVIINVPCLIALRYNRCRVIRVLDRPAARRVPPGSGR